ncbi:E3 ubiquitin-protein ligase XIAP [Denticeps clupeoides]|uniref:E3 ubiquitin-protein ligase XIAP n=1 Tax=Denticeps clupeoides TaxID=299321 RepID=A0AAY4DHR1_9TELE|nr:E3 ubiquitin-protein ligase XIAP-like [Denticeps clupeoides]XP_028816844.1 E3 ubiquitin-protein ligase XIAP-like [Denticeps clupeoides]XP_028816845.1 E3 ubiquitin-protein ligase XIAP-like [Denticeps clupeoides]XP_028816846.1 E3 ubiquitin-protein ligase XIAP-like [Denticeps clupeoides]XP_028816847.1 E3 ubiquitin-protein ligase XIAP-like [Denticeps clupeoides]XP_028816849.1 E3 ubiquitin-protein ligase XIAP-like [Denticeps clupeoides]
MDVRSREFESDGSTNWSSISARINSFQQFPRGEQVWVEQLARAGFYYTGQADQVRCFSCQGTVDTWLAEDTPVSRHRRVSPDCAFLSCVHRGGDVQATDEASEATDFSLRTGDVVDETTYPMVPHMCDEDARFQTFQAWPPSSPVRPRDLAQAGLFYEGQEDRVQCFCCGIQLSQWVSGDDPWTEHSKYSRNCFFILGHDVGNVPSLNGDSLRVSLESFEQRLETFSGKSLPVDTETLSRAGFYSSGEGDRVACFRCGGGLKNWQPGEDPWVEHARHYPGCSFVRAEKGPEFVVSVQLRSPRRSGVAASQETRFSKDGEAENILQLELSRKAVELGLEPMKVERTILENIRKTGQGYFSMNELVNDVLNCTVEGDLEASSESKDENPMEKLEKLQREKQCKVCMDCDISIVFIPCGHLVTCQKCSDSLSKCPICCAEITQKVKTYLS